MNNKKDTYYFVKYEVNKAEYECGPYSSLKDATSMLVDHIPGLANQQSLKPKYNYKAEVQERCIDEESGTWLTVSTPLMENQCRKQKVKPVFTMETSSTLTQTVIS